MLFEGDSFGVGYLNFKQFAKHVSDFIAQCMNADKKAADIVATAVHGQSGSVRISQKQLKEQARCSCTTVTIMSNTLNIITHLPLAGYLQNVEARR